MNIIRRRPKIELCGSRFGYSVAILDFCFFVFVVVVVVCLFVCFFLFLFCFCFVAGVASACFNICDTFIHLVEKLDLQTQEIYRLSFRFYGARW